MIFNFKNNIVISTIMFLLLLQFFGYTQTDTSFQRNLFSNVGNLPWQVEIDSMISLLKELGVDTCCVTGRNNHFIVGPSVECKYSGGSLGIGYRWNKEYIPKLSFFSFHYSDCSTCLQQFESLKQYHYLEYEDSEPLEVKKLYRDFPIDSSYKIRIEVWCECCPGNRVKFFRSTIGLKMK